MAFELSKIPGFRKIRDRIDEAEDQWLQELAVFVVNEHNKFTANWTNQPEFTTSFTLDNGNKSMEVTTDDVNWSRVNFGTGLRGPRKKSYDIKPKDPKGFLFFPPKYTPKTTRRKFGGSGTRSGVPIFTQLVVAKGIRPRRFDLRANKEAKKNFYPKWIGVLRRAIIRR